MVSTISQIKVFVGRYMTPPYLAAGALILILVVYFVFLRGNGEQPIQTMVVAPGSFVHEVTASGRVKAAEEIDLGFPQGGRVAHVYVNVGNTVARGALLVELENSDMLAQLAQRKAALESQEAKLAQLEEGSTAEQIAVAQAAVDTQKAAVARANDAVIDAIRDAYAKSYSAIRIDLDQFLQNPRSQSPQLLLDTSSDTYEIDFLNARVAIEPVMQDWSISSAVLSPSSDIAAAAISARDNLAQVSALFARAGILLSYAIANNKATQSEIDTYVSNISTARTTLNAATTALSTAITSRQTALSALNAAEKSLALEQSGATGATLDVQRALVRAAQADVDAAYAQLTKTRIYAPFSGTVTSMDAKKGESVAANAPEVSMISTGTFEIESFVPEINVAAISVGNPAKITLDAYGEDVVFVATVVSIDPAETVRDGVSTYRTLLKFDTADERIKAGMTATVTMTTESRENVLSVPLGSVIKRDNQSFVQIQAADGSLSERMVTTGGASSNGNIEIISGLSGGEVVVLDPSAD